MKTMPTYQEYLDDPQVRARIQAEARRARAEAIEQLVITPVREALKRLVTQRRVATNLRYSA